MTNLKPRDPARSDKSPVSNIKDLPPQQHGVFGRPFDTGEQASSFIGGVALESTRQIDQLIDDLNKLRQRWRTKVIVFNATSPTIRPLANRLFN